MSSNLYVCQTIFKLQFMIIHLRKWANLVLLILIISYSKTTLGQKLKSGSLPTLSKSEMYSDFDSLCKMIKETSPQIEIRKKITGLDIVSALDSYRNEIEKIGSTKDFATLVRKALTLCQDGHTSLIRPNYYPNDSSYLAMGVSMESVKLLSVYDSILNMSLQERKFNLKLRYIQGEYFNVYPFRHKGKIFKPGCKLISCNGQDINEHIQTLYGSKRMMRWSFEKKQWFSEDFYTGYQVSAGDSLHLTFVMENDETVTAGFDIKEPLDFLDTETSTPDTARKVEYFEQGRILYIRMPEMEDGQYYYDQIIQVAKDRLFSKVVLDIRDNPGGSDFAWMKVLSSLIAKPIIQKGLILCNNSQVIKRKFLEHSQSWKSYQVPFLNAPNMLVFNSGKSTFGPDRNSIKFKGTIYVIQNENIYSSAGSLAAVGILAENIKVVGNPTGRLLGKGVSPLLFELPYSKIMYRIEPVIDFTNVVLPEDVFHDKVEIPVELSIEQYVQRLNKANSWYTKDYLLNSDPVFRVILSE